MHCLYPANHPTSLADQLAGFDPIGAAGTERPLLFTNFAVTLDGHATIDARSGSIGSDTDTAMLMGLRSAAEAVLVGAGTIRAENYGRLLPGAEARATREERGLPPDPLAVVVSNRLELPWDAGLFTSGAGEVLVFTGSGDDPPDTATPVRVVRHDGRVDLRAALQYLRAEEGIRALLSEGGPSLHGALLDASLVDELFVTLSPKLGGGVGPRMVEGLGAGPLELELLWLLQEGDELFARYAVRGPAPAAG